MEAETGSVSADNDGIERCSVAPFASRLNAQLMQYVNCRPDPNVMAVDIPQLQWNKWADYVFLPFCLIRGIPQEVQGVQGISCAGGCDMEIPAMVSSSASILDRLPLILPKVLMEPFNNPHPLVVAGQLCLAAWKLSIKDNLQRERQDKLPTLSCRMEY